MGFSELFRDGILQSVPYSPGKPIEEVQRELGLSHISKLASNENPEGPIPEAVEAIAQAAREINRYPDGGAYDLTHALAKQLGVAPERVMLGNGSNEIVDMLIRALISPGERVVYAHPSFVVYHLTAGIHFECGRPIPLLADDRHDLPAMAEAVDASTKLVFVCNPNNPTGSYNDAEDFRAFMAQIPANVIVAVDEAYVEYVVAEDYPDTLAMLDQYPNLVIIRTFSKIHSLAGVRVGYMVGHAELVAELHKTREPFNVSSVAQAAAMACLENWHVVAGRRARNRAELERMAVALAELDFQVTPSQTNFLLVRHRRPAAELCDALLREGVIVRPMHPFGLGDGAIRISIGLPEENDHALRALKKILK
uniref:Histidinol-phosphate aminotransferase n=1 Tax=Magnetococcus massalia (strain MO-1) TaxID=451514 RepID=A0A1S7LE77_MAGMO|nr:Histidinol-phosphate aminotransferase [Candidatus Magnetococcus massalia]